LVVGQVQGEERGVVVEELYKVIDTSEFLAVKGELVTLKI
jgi:hypothetical protein